MAQRYDRISREDTWKYSYTSSRSENGVDIFEATVFFDNVTGEINEATYTSRYLNQLKKNKSDADSQKLTAKETKQKESKPKKEGKSIYWSWCRQKLGIAFWLLSPVLFIIWLPFWILKMIFKLLWIVIKLVLTILTFGLISNWLNK